MTCSKSGCDRPARSRTLCASHYIEAWRGHQHTDFPLARRSEIIVPFCCTCLTPEPRALWIAGALECAICRRGTGPAYEGMRNAYLSRRAGFLPASTSRLAVQVTAAGAVQGSPSALDREIAPQLTGTAHGLRGLHPPASPEAEIAGAS